MKTPSFCGRLLVLGGTALTTALGAFAAPGAEPTNAPVYQVVIDGKSHVLTGGRTERLTLPDGKEIAIAVHLNPVQPYRTSAIQFQYEAGLSVNDDHDATERTITLLHANGCGIVITDQGPQPDGNQRKRLLAMVDDLLGRIKQGVAKNISRAPIQSVSFAHAKGLSTTSTHLDEDGDKQTQYYYVLQCGKREVSVIGFHDPDNREAYLKIQKTVLESLREAGPRADKTGVAGNGQPAQSETNRTPSAPGSRR